MAKTHRKKTGTPCPVETYARDVVEGRIVAGQLVRLACRRHLDELATAAARGLLWDGAAATHALDFFGHLRHSTGEWAHQPFNLQPWQAFVVGQSFLDNVVAQFQATRSWNYLGCPSRKSYPRIAMMQP